MKKASSLFVLILLGSLVADAVAQTNPPRGPGYNPNQQGQGPSYNPGQSGNQQGQGPGQPQYPQQPQQPGQGQGQGPSHGGPSQYPGQPQYPQQPQQPQNPYAQNRIISQQLLQSLRSYETLRLSEALRLSQNESRDLEVLSITLSAQALRNQATVDVLSRGRSVVVPQLLRRQLSQVRLFLPALSRLDDLEIKASDEIILDNIQVEVRSIVPQVVRPLSGQLLTVQIAQSLRNEQISIKQLVRQQLGLSLDGVAIERIAIVAQSLRGAASVQLEMNGRIASDIKAVSPVARAMPLLMNSGLPVDSSLSLIVRGEIIVREISIRVGQVRGW